MLAVTFMVLALSSPASRIAERRKSELHELDLALAGPVYLWPHARSSNFVIYGVCVALLIRVAFPIRGEGVARFRSFVGDYLPPLPWTTLSTAIWLCHAVDNSFSVIRLGAGTGIS